MLVSFFSASAERGMASALLLFRRKKVLFSQVSLIKRTEARGQTSNPDFESHELGKIQNELGFAHRRNGRKNRLSLAPLPEKERRRYLQDIIRYSSSSLIFHTLSLLIFLKGSGRMKISFNSQSSAF